MHIPSSSLEEDKREYIPTHMQRLLKLPLDHLDILKFLYIPNLRSLEIHHFLIPEEIASLPRPSFGQNLFSNILRFLHTPNLRSLEILRTLIPEGTASSPRPSFDQSLSKLIVPHTSLDEFCLPLSLTEIAQSFPMLTSIHLVGSGVCRSLIHLNSIVSVSFD